MMERRKFRRRKPGEGEARNRIVDDIEPGPSVPKPERAQRVFARSGAAPLPQRKAPDDIVARAAAQADSPNPPATDAARQEIEEKRRRIAELKREKARLEERRARRAEAEAQAETEQAEAARLQQERRAEAERRARARAEHMAQEARLAAEQQAAEDGARRSAEEAAAAKLAPVTEAPTVAPALVLPKANRITADLSQPRKPEAAAPEPAPRKDADSATALWEALPSFSVDEAQLERSRVISAARRDLAHTAFDVLRTRLLQALRQKGWSRVAITSPSKDCGKTFSAANLALSLARQENCRTILLDFDMRRPSLAKVFGVQNAGRLGDMLRGDTAPEDHLRVLGPNSLDVGRNLAIGFNDRVEPYASELLQDGHTADVLKDMERRFKADILLFDMPPALYHDDVIAARSLFDGVLLVVGGGITKAGEVKDVERRLGADTPLLGTVLNFSEGPGITRYSY